MPEDILVRRANESDLLDIAKINSDVFLGNRDNLEAALDWVTSHFRFFPVYHYFVLICDGKVVGYIGWQIQGGSLRATPAVELEQLGISKKHEGRGFATLLTEKSKIEMLKYVVENNNRIESKISLVVWVDANNDRAIAVYRKIFTDGVICTRRMFDERTELMLRVQVTRASARALAH